MVPFQIILLVFTLATINAGFLGNIFGAANELDERAGEHRTKNNECENNRVEPRISFAIVGGRQVREKSTVPYAVAVGNRLQNGSIRWYCGGSLISPTVVLTAAHCLTPTRADVVRIGATFLTSDRLSQDIAVESITVHPEYRSPSLYHDIAVLQLVTAPTSRGVRPVCLARGDSVKRGDEATVIGWGAEAIGGDGQQELAQVKVEVFSNEECDSAYSNSTISQFNFPRGIIQQQLCAGNQRGGKDACQGDSGGPLVIKDGGGVIRQIGVVSAGSGCGTRAFPGVYVRISEYYQWLNKFI